MAATYTFAGRLSSQLNLPSSCLDTVLIASTVNADGERVLAATQSFRYPGAERLECFPDNMNFGDLTSLSTAAYYSPARCPQYYTPYRVTRSIPGVITVAPSAPATADGDNVYLCCPGPLTPDNVNQKLECASFYRRSTAFDVHSYNNKVNPGVIEPATVTTLSSGFPYTFLAYGIQVRFQNSDVKGLDFDEDDVEVYGLRRAVLGGTFAITTTSARETADSQSDEDSNAEPTGSAVELEENSAVESSGSEESLTASTATDAGFGSIASSSSTSVSRSSANSGGGSGGLSTGAKIGIGLGIPLVILIIAFIALLIFLRKRSKRRPAPDVPAAPPAAAFVTSPAHNVPPVYEADPEAKIGTNSRVQEVSGYHSPPGFRVESLPTYGTIHEANGYNPHELGGNGRYEIDGNARYEADGFPRQQPHELHGSGRMPF